MIVWMREVAIIGGGVAGLAAAGRLRARGVDAVVIEGRMRLGGRVHTRRGDGWPAPVEDGAEFVHGRDPALMRAIKRARLHADVVPDHHWLKRGHALRDGDPVWERALPLMADDAPRDRSMSARIAASARETDEPTRDLALMYVEGFHAAPPGRASARALTDQERAAEAVHGDEIRRVREGYDALVSHLADGLEVRLGTVVERIAWRAGRVTLALRSSLGHPLPPESARRAIVTLPLGVLQARPGAAAVQWSPSLPPDKRQAIAALGMGDVVKVALWLRAPVWARYERRLGELAFLHERRAAIPTWWRPLPFEGPMLVGWAAGPRAKALAGKSPLAVARIAVASLAATLELTPATVERALQAWHVYDWSSDPFAAGAYSWVPVGAVGAQRALAAPVAGTLFFAGEASSYDGASGTVHGALATGLRAADELLSSR
jgi:monoamine oxidase